MATTLGDSHLRRNYPSGPHCLRARGYQAPDNWRGTTHAPRCRDNFFGHHGKPPDDHAILEVDEIECVVGKRIRGGRFFEHKLDYKGQITFFESEVYRDLCHEFAVWD